MGRSLKFVSSMFDIKRSKLFVIYAETLLKSCAYVMNMIYVTIVFTVMYTQQFFENQAEMANLPNLPKLNLPKLIIL